MRIRIYAVGRIRQREWLALIDDYFSRIAHYVKCEIVESRDDEELQQRPLEADFIVALEVGGARMTSTQFARKLESWSRRGQGRIAFIIGGSEGIPAALVQKAHFQLSLSDMTLPHRFARLLLVEQIYRAQTILRGEPYARES